MAGLIVLVVLLVFAVFLAARTVRVIPQARAGVVERWGRYSRTLAPGLNVVVPFIDRVRPLIDLREQVVTFPPQPVITEDNVSVGIDTVLYFTITNAKDASYEVANPLQAIEQLTVTTLRNIVGDLTLEETLTSRDRVNDRLRAVLDERTGKWGIRINGVEIKSIDPPGSIQEAMEKQMRAERDRRAAILNAEGVKQSQILTAEGEKQSAVLRAEGAKEAAILRAEGEAQAIDTVFRAIHAGDPDPKLLSYQYLQMLPQLARGEANKIWVIPSEFTQALGGLTGAMGGLADRGASPAPPPTAGDEGRPDGGARSLPPGPPPAPPQPAAGEPSAPPQPAAGEPSAPSQPAAGEPSAPPQPAAGEPSAPPQPARGEPSAAADGEGRPDDGEGRPDDGAPSLPPGTSPAP